MGNTFYRRVGDLGNAPLCKTRKPAPAAKCTESKQSQWRVAGFCGGPAGRLGFAVAGWVLRWPGGVLGQTRICAFSRKTKRPTGPSLRRLLGARTTANTHTGGCVYRGPLEAHELVRGFWRSHLRLWLVCFFCSGAQGTGPEGSSHEFAIAVSASKPRATDAAAAASLVVCFFCSGAQGIGPKGSSHEVAVAVSASEPRPNV